MPVEKINRYKKSLRLAFADGQAEQAFQKDQTRRGRSTGIYALIALIAINLTFAFLEYWILGINSTTALYGYLSIAGLTLLVVAFSAISHSTTLLMLRILLPGILTFCVLIGSIYLEQYRLYHAAEIVLLTVWLASLNILSFRMGSLTGLLTISIFLAAAFFSGGQGVKISGLLALLVAAYALAIYLSYMLERFRRMLFLSSQAILDVFDRQENWAYTLIDLDMSLSGILNFRELVERLMEHIKTVIEFDSFVLTSLEGKGPKPEADVVDGTLFENEDKTLWPEDLLTRLSQTRQSAVSAQFDLKKGFMGKEKKVFLHYRLDIPVINGSSLAGVVSLRRVSAPFDDLDMVSSVSIATQAMMIFNRTVKSSKMSVGMQSIAPVAPKKGSKESSSASTDIDLTAEQTISASHATSPRERDVTVVPSDVVKKMQQESASARKTITLLSRENAEHVSMDRYRTAAVEGEPLSLLLVEVDGLSSIREKDGDQAAYKVFASIVKYVFAKTDTQRDVLGRYGQNGFSVLLPRVDMNAAENFAEGLRMHTEEASFKTPYGERTATLSVGVASITDETGNYDSMVKRADMALFVAKKNGRNCVKVRL